MKRRFQVCAAAVIMLASPALAQLSASQTIGYLDLDKDGKVSLNEYLTFQQPRLSQYDANGNGRLSRDEFKASLAPAAQKSARESFRVFDANKDGGLSQEEFLGYHAFVFKNYFDSNKDGFITAEEWRKVMGG
jgi:Ca2+-binding EF-hand superfamily protein